jgi:hypothetical protein
MVYFSDLKMNLNAVDRAKSQNIANAPRARINMTKL